MVDVGTSSLPSVKTQLKKWIHPGSEKYIKKEKHSGNENCSKHENEGFQMC